MAVIPQRVQRSAITRQLAANLMGRPNVPVYGTTGALANLAQGLGGGLLMRQAGRQAEQEQKTEQDSLARAIRAAARAQGLGEDQTSNLATIGGLFPQAGQAIVGNLAQQLSAPPAAPELVEDVAGRQRFASGEQFGELAFPEAQPQQIETLSQQEALSLGFQPGQVVQRTADGKLLTPGSPMVNLNMGMEKPLSPEQARDLGVPIGTKPSDLAGQTLPKKYTAEQTSSAGYANRMDQAEARIKEIEEAAGGSPGADPVQRGLAVLPGVGRYATSENFKLHKQAQEDWVRAKLRKESGAVIGAEEMRDEILTYFPQPGDTAAVVDQKRKSRQTATNNLIQQSQGAYDELFKPSQPDPGEVVEAQAEAIQEAPLAEAGVPAQPARGEAVDMGNLQEGRRVTDRDSGRTGVVRGGQIVWDDEQQFAPGDIRGRMLPGG